MVQPIYYPDHTTERIVGIGYRRSFFGRLIIELLIETTHRHPSPWLSEIEMRTVSTRRDARADDAPAVTEYLRRAQPELSMHGGFVFRPPRMRGDWDRPAKPPAPLPSYGCRRQA